MKPKMIFKTFQFFLIIFNPNNFDQIEFGFNLIDNHIIPSSIYWSWSNQITFFKLTVNQIYVINFSILQIRSKVVFFNLIFNQVISVKSMTSKLIPVKLKTRFFLDFKSIHLIQYCFNQIKPNSFSSFYKVF